MKIQIKNFRNIIDLNVEIKKGEVNYFLGANESGKTNLLQAIRMFDERKTMILEEKDVPIKIDGSKYVERPSFIISDGNSKNIINEKNVINFMNVDSNASNKYRECLKTTKTRKNEILLELQKKIDTFKEIEDEEIEDEEIEYEYDDERLKKWKESKKLKELIENVYEEKKIDYIDWNKLINFKFRFFSKIKSLYYDMIINYPNITYIEPIIKAKEKENTSYNYQDIFNENSNIRNIFEAFLDDKEIQKLKELEKMEDSDEREKFEDYLFKNLNAKIKTYFEKYPNIKAFPYFKPSSGKITLLIETKNKNWIFDSHNENQRSLGFKTFLRIIIELKSIFSKGTKSIYIIDEPEQSLHPFLQNELIKEIEKFKSKNLTIIIASHSPYIVQINDFEDIKKCVYIDRKKDGSVKIIEFNDTRKILKEAEKYFAEDEENEKHHFLKIIYDSFGMHNIYSMLHKKIKSIRREINKNKNVEKNKKNIEELILMKNFLNEK